MSERAELFKIGIQNGITDRNTIIKMYNSFGDGGNTSSVSEKLESVLETTPKQFVQALKGYAMAQARGHQAKGSYALAKAGLDAETFTLKYHLDQAKRGEFDDPGQDAFLFSKKEQEKAFLNSGYRLENSKDYGLVKKAVGDRDLRIYKKNEDVIPRDSLTVVANPDIWLGDVSEELEHPGYAPTALYIDKDGNFYQQSWDLQDYGIQSAGSKGASYSPARQIIANAIDILGNPVVRKSGIRPVKNIKEGIILLSGSPNAGNTINKVFEYLPEKEKNNIVQEILETEYVWMLRNPEFTSSISQEKFNNAKQKLKNSGKDYDDLSVYMNILPFDEFKHNLNRYFTKEALYNLGIPANYYDKFNTFATKKGSYAPAYNYNAAYKRNKNDGGKINRFETGGPKNTKHVEDVVRTTRGSTGKIFTKDFPWVDVVGAKHLFDSWRVMRGSDKKVAPSDDNYTGTAMKGVGVQTDDGLGFASQQDLANVLGYTPTDFVDAYVYGDTPFEELGVFKKETSPERHVVRSKVKKVEDSGKQVNTYQTQRDTLDTNTVAALDSLLNTGLVDLHSENTTYQKSPFNIGDSGIIYDGNNSTIATAYLPNGMPVSKAIDVFDTDPKEWNYKVGPLAKTGLGFIHDNTNPFLMTTPWYYPIKSTDYLSRLYYLFGIDADREYNVRENKGDKNGVIWELSEALEWLDNHPDLTEMPVKTKKD